MNQSPFAPRPYVTVTAGTQVIRAPKSVSALHSQDKIGDGPLTLSFGKDLGSLTQPWVICGKLVGRWSW